MDKNLLNIDPRFIRADIDTYKPKFYLLMDQCEFKVVRYSEENNYER